MKKFLVAGLLILCASQSYALSVNFTNTSKFWWYGNFTALLSPQLSATAMFGTRYEFLKDVNAVSKTPAGNALIEFLAGPVYTIKLGDNMKLKVPLWYYYMGFPSYSTSSHSVDVMPTLDFKMNDKINFGLRIILHNTLYSTYYAAADQFGYSLLARGMPSITYKLTDKISLYGADELFLGLITNPNAPAVAGRGDGFCAKGFQANRIYIGAIYTIDPNMSISPQYIFETNYDENKDVSSVQHYIYVAFNYVMQLYK